MSKARSMVEDSSAKESSQWLTTIKSSSQFLFANLVGIAQWSYINARHIGWFIVTTGIITAFPLIFEIKREASLEEDEMRAIGKELAEGKTPQDLAMEGMTSAIEPKVLK